MQKILKPLLIILVLVVIGIFVIYKIGNQPIADQDKGSTLTLYYRTDCPHCQNVEQFLTDNQVSEKISYNLKEVGANSRNASELMAKAKICKINPAEVGVPFLWDGEKCFTGDTDIIDFFKKKMEETASIDVSDKCPQLERETRANLNDLLDQANYCNSDSDCISDDAMLACPFGCHTILRNKNADVTAIKSAANQYYNDCPVCIYDCNNPAPKQADIKCQNKKCITSNVLPE